MASGTVRDVMTTDVRTVSRSASLRHLREVMADGRFRHVPVVEDGAVIGVVSERDLGRALVRIGGAWRPEDVDDMAVAMLMTAPVETVAPSEPVAAAGARMVHGSFGCLPVVEDGALIGIVTETDVVRHLTRA